MGIPSYLKELIKLYPNIKSGRKNYFETNKRIEKNIKLIKKYLSKKNNKN